MGPTSPEPFFICKKVPDVLYPRSSYQIMWAEWTCTCIFIAIYVFKPGVFCFSLVICVLKSTNDAANHQIDMHTPSYLSQNGIESWMETNQVFVEHMALEFWVPTIMEMLLLHEVTHVDMTKLCCICKKGRSWSLPCPRCTRDKNIWFLSGAHHSVFNASVFSLVLKKTILSSLVLHIILAF